MWGAMEWNRIEMEMEMEWKWTSTWRCVVCAVLCYAIQYYAVLGTFVCVCVCVCVFFFSL